MPGGREVVSVEKSAGFAAMANRSYPPASDDQGDKSGSVPGSRFPSFGGGRQAATEAKKSLTSWVEIDLDAIAGNVASVRGMLEPGVRLLAVVKADGYGHGLVPTARVAIARGAEMLGVTHPEEGATLRQAGITMPVLVFRPLLPGEEDAAVQCGLTLSAGSLHQAQRLSAAAGRTGQPAAVHLEIETGMGRTGFAPEALRGALD